jgi:hypothetical protein
MYIETPTKHINEQSKNEAFDSFSKLSCSLVISDNPALNARFYNWCISQNIIFIGQLISYNEGQFASFRGIGDLILTKVKQALEKQGLCFKGSMSDDTVKYLKQWAKKNLNKAHLKNQLIATTYNIKQKTPCKKQLLFIESIELACSAAFSNSFLDLTIKQLRFI